MKPNVPEKEAYIALIGLEADPRDRVRYIIPVNDVSNMPVLGDGILTMISLSIIKMIQ